MKTAQKIRSSLIVSKRSQDFWILQLFRIARGFIWLAEQLKEDHVKFLVRVVYLPFSHFNRKVCRRNLAAIFQPLNRNPAQVENIYRKYLEYMVRFQAETARCFSIGPTDLEKKVLLKGEAHLQETLKKGRGALLVSGHMGTWWHVPCLLAARGYKIKVVFNSFPPPVERYLEQSARRCGIALSFVDRGVPKAMQHASTHNEIVYLTFDVSVRKHRPNWLPFGSTKININPGPAILALRHQMPAHFVSSFHGDPERSHAIIHPETLSENKNNPEHPNSLCRPWVDKLYSDVLVHPEQWWGMGFSDLPRVLRRQ